MDKKNELEEVGKLVIRDYIIDSKYAKEWFSAMQQSGATIFVALRTVKKND